MDYVLNKLTDLSLRRLYKFVLKRTIGKYLEDELLIDQLEVRSRDGLVRLSDLRINAQVLNDEMLEQLPVKIVSVTISQLEVHLSYTTLLTDSCRFVVDTIDIVVAPNELYLKQKANQQAKPKSDVGKRDETEESATPSAPLPQSAEEGQKGLSFIAHWIEVVVARLQVQVGAINITFQLPVNSGPTQRKNTEPLSRSKLSAPVTHHTQLCLRGLHYFNDDPRAYAAGTDASSIAISTKLTVGADASVAHQLGARKLVKLESILVQLVPVVPSSTSLPLPLVRMSSHLAAVVKLDKTQRGQLKGVDLELTVPNLVLSMDTHSAKCLSAVVATFLALSAPDSPRPGASSGGFGEAARTAAEQAAAKTVLQRVLMSDPTLRTLFWLEEEENRKKKGGGKAAVGTAMPPQRAAGAAGGAAGAKEGEEIDFARVAQLMRQYRTTRNAIAPPEPPLSQSTLTASAMLGASRIVESDSDGEFPASVGSASDQELEDTDNDSVDSAEFHDAFAKKPVMRVKMGDSARKGGLASSVALGTSTYGGASRMGGESGLFHSTTSGLLGAGASQVHNSGYSGSIYASNAPPLVLTARLHLVSTEVVFTHLPAQAAIRALAVEASSGSSAGAAEPARDELCLRMEETVVRVSTVIMAAPSAPPQHGFLKVAPAAENPRNSITCNISMGEVQLFESFGALSYDTVRALRLHRTPPQRQVMVSFHSLKDSRRIYSSPHVGINIDYLPAAEKSPLSSPTERSSCASVKATVNLEPVVVSTSVATIEHWIQGLSGFPLIGVTEEESSTSIACDVNLVQLELFLHCDSRAEGYRALSMRSGQTDLTADDGAVDAHAQYWDTVLDAVDLATHPEAWQSLHSTDPLSPYYEHLLCSRGGFRFLLADINIKLSTTGKPKARPSLADSALSGSISSAEKKCRQASSEPMFKAVEMSQVALYVYLSLPVLPTQYAANAAAAGDAVPETETRRRFYCTLMAKASASGDGVHKVMISRTNPNATSAVSRQPSEDPEDQDFVLLRDAHKAVPSMPIAAAELPRRSAPTPAAGTAAAGADLGPAAPAVDAANLIYVSAYHIQVDIKQREYNVLMMVSDSIAPKPIANPTAPAAAKVTSPTSPTAGSGSRGGFGFVLSSKLATICLSDNEPYQFAFPELDALIAEAQQKSAQSRKQSAGKSASTTSSSASSKSFSICVSIIEPSIEVLISNKDIYLSIKADDLSIYEMELAQFRSLLQAGFDFNQTTGREARYGPNRHLVPFIRRASLHSLDTNSGAKNEAFSTLLGNNQDYGRAFEVRLLLTSSTAAIRDASTPVAEVKSVSFFIDFYDVMLSYDPQSTWILSVANMLTPQTAAQILCHRQEQRVRAAVRRYEQLTAEQKRLLGSTLEEIVANLTAEQTCQPSSQPSGSAGNGTGGPRTTVDDGQGGLNTSGSGKKGPITLTLPFELTKVSVRVRNCIVDFCCSPCSSRTFLTIGLLTVTSTIASNSQRFSLKFKVGGLALYISDILPLPTVQELQPRSDRFAVQPNVAAALDSSRLGDSSLNASGLRRSRFRQNPGLSGTSRHSAYTTAAAREPGSEIYDEDIGQFFRAHAFVDLASVDHIDVLVTINNSDSEALVIQINIGLCSINACMDSLELFTKTMQEWFLEFQIACAKSEEVMQKKVNKPIHDLGASQYAFRAPTGNLLDDDNFDTIRFCDTLPGALTNYRGGAGVGVGPGGVRGSPEVAAVAHALPAGMLDDVNLADLVAKAEKDAAAGKSNTGIFVNSAAATADMTDLVVEDYYAGLSLPTEPAALPPLPRLEVRPNAKVGVFSPFPASPHDIPPHQAVEPGNNGDYRGSSALGPTVAANKGASGVKDVTSPKRNLPEPKFVAHYDYGDEDSYEDFGHPTGPALHETQGPTATSLPDEEEGVGGYYGTDVDANADQGDHTGHLAARDMIEVVESSDDEGGVAEQHDGPPIEEGAGGDEPGTGGDGDDEHSLASVKSITLGESHDQGDDENSLLSRSGVEGEDEVDAAPALKQSVFGLGSWAAWRAAPAPAKKVQEDVELQDFNPNAAFLRSVSSEEGERTGEPAASAAPAPSAAVSVSVSGDGNEWLQQELSASPRTSQLAQSVTATSKQQSDIYAQDSDPEDAGEWQSSDVPAAGVKKTNFVPEFEADFSYDDAPFEADFGEDAEAVGAGPVLMDQTIHKSDANMPDMSVLGLATDLQEGDGAGWSRYPEDLRAGSTSAKPSPRNTQSDAPAAAASATTPAPVNVTTLLTAGAASGAPDVSPLQKVPAVLSPGLDDLDRAWQQTNTDYIYTEAVERKQTELSAAASVSAPPPAVVTATAAMPVLGTKKSGKVVQPIQAAQWYQDPDKLEIMPHYIPVVSRLEDLDDNRPAEERSLNTKMLMKLKGTFKIRLFEGSDWPRKATAATEGTATAASAGGKGAVPSPVPATADVGKDSSSGVAGGAGKAVRFRKEDLLRDLTTPAASGGSGRPAGMSSVNSVKGSAQAAGRPPRSSRPLFEESVAVGYANTNAPPSGAKSISTAEVVQADPQPPKPRNEREMLDATFKDLFFCVRVYDNSTSAGSTSVVYSLPAQRVVVSALDFLISFGKVGVQRKKVLGSWTSKSRPRDTLEPVLRIAFLAYENPPLGGESANPAATAAAVVMEHRLYVRVLPLRCYLDEQMINFAKALAASHAPAPAPAPTAEQTPADEATMTAASSGTSAGTQQNEASPAPSELFFQSILIAAMDIKIDYRASTVNIQALNKGDYLQLLNIFPLDGLEITLKHVKLNGVRGVGAAVQRMGEFWVKDIYANQLHRVISGTAPFRGLSNIGNDLQELLAIPLRDYRKSGGTMKHLRRSTRTLVRTVTRETLHATQQLTMFVANAISELASDSPVGAPRDATQTGTLTPPPRTAGTAGTTSGQVGQVVQRSAPSQERRRSSRSAPTGPPLQPAGVVEGLQLAYGSVTRELGAAAETVIAIPIREYVHTGPGGYLKSVIRAFPIAVLRPVAGVVEGISYTMLGLRNNIDPAARLDEEDIWNVDLGTAFPSSPGRVANVSYRVREDK